jgi:Glycosyltransferase family 87
MSGERRPSRAGAVWAAVGGILAASVVASAPESPFHPLLPEGYGPGPLAPVARFVGLDALSRDALAGVGIVAMVLAVSGFLLALREAWRGGISLRTAVAIGIAFHVMAVALPLLFSRDVFSYAIYGRISSVYHQNPYLAVPSDFRSDPIYPLVGEQWTLTPAVYGPAFTLLSVGLTKLIDGAAGLILAYKAITGAASLATLLVVVSVARRVRPERAAFAALLIGWNPVILFHTVAGGHNDVLVGLAVAVALALVLSGRELWATAALAAGALVKATAVVPLALLVAWAVARRPAGRRLPVLATHLGVSVGLFLLAATPFLSRSDPTLGQLELAGHEGWLAPSNLFGRVSGKLGEIVGGDPGRAVGEAALRIVFPVVLVVALLAVGRHLVRRAGQLEAEGLGAIWGWSLLIFIGCAPILLPWYVAWLLPLAWLLPRVPQLATVGVATALAVSEMVAEPLRSRQVFEAMVLALHYVITPVVFLGLLWVLRDLRDRLRDGLPLEAERPRHQVAATGC